MCDFIPGLKSVVSSGRGGEAGGTAKASAMFPYAVVVSATGSCLSLEPGLVQWELSAGSAGDPRSRQARLVLAVNSTFALLFRRGRALSPGDFSLWI